MKIHLKQIPLDGLHLEGEEDCPLGELAGQDIEIANTSGVSFTSNVQVNGNLNVAVAATVAPALVTSSTRAPGKTAPVRSATMPVTV